MTSAALPHFKLSKRFRSKTDAPITSIDFDNSGQFLISTSTDESIRLYDTFKGKYLDSIFSKKYGCHLAKFTHNSHHNAIYSSTKDEDNIIRYLSLDDNSYIRYFKGHKGMVASLQVHPRHDIFISSSYDNTAKLWDLRASNPQASIPYHSPAHIAFDPTGMVVGVTSVVKKELALLDTKMFDASPFVTAKIPPNFEWNKIEFSNDGKYILLSSVGTDHHLLLDAYDGKLVSRLTGIIPIPPSNFPDSGTASFSPDGKYVVSGNGAGNIVYWSLDTKPYSTGKLPPVIRPAGTLMGDDRPRMVSWNPKYLEIVSADISMHMWVPDI